MSMPIPDGITKAEANPQPPVWPQCERCGEPYVLRLCYFMSGKREWCWQRDCAKPRSTCKGASAIVAGPDGPMPT